MKKNNKPASGFEAIDHTADVGLHVWGRTLEELFCFAAAGMSSFLTSLEDIKIDDSKSITIKGNDYEEMLVDWLNELIYAFAHERFVFRKFSVKIDEKNFWLKAKCWGEKVDTSKREFLHELKAATFSDLKIRKSKKGYSTSIIFDV